MNIYLTVVDYHQAYIIIRLNAQSLINTGTNYINTIKTMLLK